MHPTDWTPAPNARLWIHTADRILSSTEQANLLSDLRSFLAGWAAHGSDLKAEAVVLLDRILVISLDLDCAPATGCSIDSLLGFIRDHGKRTTVDWFDRHQVVFWEKGDASVPCDQLRTPEFWARRKAGLVVDSTLICDPLIAVAGEWPVFIKPFSDSWHAKMWD